MAAAGSDRGPARGLSHGGSGTHTSPSLCTQKIKPLNSTEHTRCALPQFLGKCAQFPFLSSDSGKSKFLKATLTAEGDWGGGGGSATVRCAGALMRLDAGGAEATTEEGVWFPWHLEVGKFLTNCTFSFFKQGCRVSVFNLFFLTGKVCVFKKLVLNTLTGRLNLLYHFICMYKLCY